MDARPQLAIVSTTSRRGHGGLATYTDRLIRLAQGEYEVTNVARFERDGSTALEPATHDPPATFRDEFGTVSIVGPAPIRRAALRMTRKLIHRVPLQGLAVRSFSTAYRPSISAALPTRPAAMHVVGAGWELLGFPAAAVATRAGIPLTVCAAIHPGQWGDSQLDGRLYRTASVVFALSQDEAKRLRELGVSPDRIVVCPLGPTVLDGGDGARFRAAHGLGDRPIVLFVGRKQRYKGFHALYEAMSAVTAAIPGATLVAAGRPGETLPNATAPEGYLNLGECSEMEKADALAACDVFCMPSVGEAFGIAYVDAWSYAKPVVTGPAPAPLELLRASGAGLSAQQDPRAVADALIRLLGDREYGRALGRKGLDYQKQHWTWDRVWTLHAQAWRRAA